MLASGLVWLWVHRVPIPLSLVWDKMAQLEQLHCFCGGLAACNDVTGRCPLTSTGTPGPNAGLPATRPSSGRLDRQPPRRVIWVPHLEITLSGQAHLCPRPATDLGAPRTTRIEPMPLCVERGRVGGTSRGPRCSGPHGATLAHPADDRGVACGDRHGKFLCCLL